MRNRGTYRFIKLNAPNGTAPRIASDVTTFFVLIFGIQANQSSAQFYCAAPAAGRRLFATTILVNAEMRWDSLAV